MGPSHRKRKVEAQVTYTSEGDCSPKTAEGPKQFRPVRTHTSWPSTGATTTPSHVPVFWKFKFDHCRAGRRGGIRGIHQSATNRLESAGPVPGLAIRCLPSQLASTANVATATELDPSPSRHAKRARSTGAEATPAPQRKGRPAWAARLGLGRPTWTHPGPADPDSSRRAHQKGQSKWKGSSRAAAASSAPRPPPLQSSPTPPP